MRLACAHSRATDHFDDPVRGLDGISGLLAVRCVEGFEHVVENRALVVLGQTGSRALEGAEEVRSERAWLNKEDADVEASKLTREGFREACAPVSIPRSTLGR